MSRLGTFSLKAYPTTWFNDLATPAGWLPQDVVPLLAVPPPPPPPPPPPHPRPPIVSGSGGGGGGGGISGPYRPPDWLLPFIPPYYLPEIEEESESEEDTDYAILHVTDGAVVRALAAGVVESFVNDASRTSVVLTADDGTRYWYADVGKTLIRNGARVRHGEPIARTKSDASTSVPTITTPNAAAALPAHVDAAFEGAVSEGALAPIGDPLPEQTATPPKPTQVVFVEAPPQPEPYPIPPPPPPQRVYRLLPVQQPAALVPPPPNPPLTASPIVRAVARFGIVAAILAALAWIDGKRSLPPNKRPPPPPKPKRPKDRPKKQAKERPKKRRR